MAVINRTNDVSEQKDLIEQNFFPTATGATYLVHKAPRSQVITDAKMNAIGISGSPTATLALERFVVGAGLTHINISGALTVQAVGTSGTQTFSLPAAGSSLLALAPGDLIVMTTGGANSATAQSLVEVVVQNIADIKAWYA